MVIHPRGFPEKTLFAIDQYVMKGGNLLVLVDPNAVSDRMGMIMGGPSASPDAGFGKLMDKWGIELKANSFAGDKYLSGMGRFSANQPPGRMLPLVNCDRRCTEQYKDNITAGIKQSMFIFPGVLKVREVKKVKHAPVISTTPKGNSYTAIGHELNNPQMLVNKFREGDKPVVMGYKALGKFRTAFPVGIKPEKGKKKADFVKESQKESAVLVFSDVDFINDQFAFRRTFLGLAVSNDNSAIFLNSVEALTGDVDLMSVRAKGGTSRRFDVVDAIELEAEKRTSDKVKEINGSISMFQKELNELGKTATAGNIALLQNEGIKKKKELAKKIAILKKELRSVKRHGREKVERIGKFFQAVNTLLVPVLIAGCGIYYGRRRKNFMKREKSKGGNIFNEPELTEANT